MVQLSTLVATATLATSALAHGVHSPEELVKRDLVWNKHKRSLADCGTTLKGRGLAERAVSRRSQWAEKIRKERGITEKPWLGRRDLTELEAYGNITHQVNMTGVTVDDYSTLFGSNFSCVLTPEVTEGPYYVEGELFRQNVTEDQQGVPLFLDVQVIDTNTCDPLPDLFVDIWNANATGVYSGVVVDGNGDGTEDQTNLNNTFLRGVWQADDEGVVQFTTLFPGHYAGRAIHTHLIMHQGGFITSNYTFHGGNITHVGQLFWDESLRSAVEATEPYASNTQDIVSNNDDMWAPEQASDEYDPYPEYMYVDPTDITKGLIAWISMGVDASASRDVSVAAYLTSSGGVTNPDQTLGGGSGGGSAPNGTSGGNGTAPPS